MINSDLTDIYLDENFWDCYFNHRSFAHTANIVMIQSWLKICKVFLEINQSKMTLDVHFSPGLYHWVSRHLNWSQCLRHFLTLKVSHPHTLCICVLFRWLWWEDWFRPECAIWWERENHLQLLLLPFCLLPGIPLRHDDRHQLVPVSDTRVTHFVIVVQYFGILFMGMLIPSIQAVCRQ